MKKIILVIILTIILGVKFSYSQEKKKRYQTPTSFILKLHNGKESIVTNHPIFLLGQLENTTTPKEKDLKSRNIILLLIKSSVTKLLSLEDIFRAYNVNLKDRSNYSVITGMEKESIPIESASDIYATDNSIESITLDREKKIIIIKLFSDK